jgi:ABC-type uncharacterized transport system YnjBCD ATPase subunit
MIPRRALIGWLFAASTGLAAMPAWGGSYLFRTAVLVTGADRECTLMRRRLFDKELAGVLHRVALERIAAARSMAVPPEVTKAHPHCLLVLEAFERAMDAALRGQAEAFVVAEARARAELSTLRAVLREGGWELPAVP